MPDNVNSGSLEDVLIQCAEVHYSDLLRQAGSYLRSIDRARLSEPDLAELDRPAGYKKAQIGAVSAVLKPGKAIQASIADNRWLEGLAAEQPGVTVFRTFLRDLLDEPVVCPFSASASVAPSSP